MYCQSEWLWISADLIPEQKSMIPGFGYAIPNFRNFWFSFGLKDILRWQSYVNIRVQMVDRLK